VQEGLGSDVAIILDGGACEVGLESTVISLLEEKPRILRPGAITSQQLQALLGVPLHATAQPQPSTAPLLSPGMLAKHYSPHTAVRIRNTSIERTLSLPPRVGVILFAPEQLPFTAHEVRILSATGNLTEVAASLFAALRELDKANLDLILVDSCEPAGLGEAIMDRLLRAAAKE
jgi:L-threonylcarbamoyladenylate synthase